MILVVCWAAFFGPALLGGRFPCARDLTSNTIPVRHVWAQALGHGTLPLWDASTAQGRPLLATPIAGGYYPGTLLFLMAGAERAATWHLALHHVLFVVGSYWLCRRMGAATASAFVGGAAAATGVVFSMLLFINNQAALALAPWALGFAARPPETVRRAAVGAMSGGALIGLAFLAGEPVTALATAVLWAVVALYGWRRHAVLGVVVAAAAAVATSAPLLVPLLATFPDTVRGSVGVVPGALAADALAPRRWLELLFPHLLGAPLGDASFGFWARPSFPWQRYLPLIFVGSLPILTGCCAPRRRHLAPWWLAALAGVLGAALLASPTLASAAAAVPGLRAVRYGIKLLVWTGLAAPVLTAFGWQRLAEFDPRAARARAGWALASLVLLVPFVIAPTALLRPALVQAYPASRTALAETATGTLAGRLAFDGVALALPLAALAVAGPSALVVGVAALGASALSGSEVWLVDDAARWARPPALARLIAPGSAIAVFATAAKPDEGPSGAARMYWSYRAALTSSYGQRFGLGYVLDHGPDDLEPARQEVLASLAERLPLPARARVAQALGAVAVIASEPVAGWQTREVDGVWLSTPPVLAGGAYMASRMLPAQGPRATLETLRLPAFRPGQDAVVEGEGPSLTLGGGSVEERAGVPHHRHLVVDSAGSGLLVVQQSFMRCWRARVDGRSASVEPVNGVVIGVRTPGGRHEVELSIDTRPYWLGLLGPVLLVLAALAVKWPRPPSVA